MPSSRSSRRARGGYSLIELMVVVMIIGLSVAAFGPGFSRAMDDRNVSTASRELIRIGRRARSDTFGYLRAHLLWIDPENRRVQLLRGPTQSCTSAPWASIQGDCANSALAMNSQRCLENVFFTDWRGNRDIIMHEELLNGSAVSYRKTARAICYAPSGEMFTAANAAIATAAGALSNLNTVSGGVVITFHLDKVFPGTEAPVEPPDLVHRVLFPFGSSPRALR